VDFKADAGQPVEAPISGYVTKIGYAYPGEKTLKFRRDHQPGAELCRPRLLCGPGGRGRDAVALGHEIARPQPERKYPGGMTNHVHLEIMDRPEHRIDAARMIVARYEPQTAVAD